MSDEQANQDKCIACALCGRLFSADEIGRDNNSDQPLCDECSAEKNSCGCSDD